jgi:CO/xanthine dehydrogenase Mo-binding subunit
MPVAWNRRFAGSSVLARWLPPAFNNGLDPDTTEGAMDLAYALPNMRVEYLRVKPPGIPTAFWRSVGPFHNVFVTESFMGRTGRCGEARSGRLWAGPPRQVAPRQSRARVRRGKGRLGTALA